MKTIVDHYLIRAFLRHQDELLQFLVRKVDCRETAADLMQDTYLRIAQLEANEQILNPRAFLYRVAGNLAFDYLRRQLRREQWDGGEIPEDSVCSRPQPEAVLAGYENLLRLNRLLSQLPPQSRCLFIACRIEGKTYRQIADEQRISQKRAERIVLRTRLSS